LIRQPTISQEQNGAERERCEDASVHIIV
jgi:hypothetical protein